MFQRAPGFFVPVSESWKNFLRQNSHAVLKQFHNSQYYNVMKMCQVDIVDQMFKKWHGNSTHGLFSNLRKICAQEIMHCFNLFYIYIYE